MPSPSWTAGPASFLCARPPYRSNSPGTCSAMIARSCPARPCTDHHAAAQWPGCLLLRCSQSQAEPPQLAGAIHELLHAGGVRREMPWPPSLVSGRRLTPRVGTPGNDEPRSGRQSMPAHDVHTRRDAGRGLLDVLRRGQRPASPAAAETGRASGSCRRHTSGQGPARRYMVGIFSPLAAGMPLPAACCSEARPSLQCGTVQGRGRHGNRLVWEGTGRGSNFSGARCMNFVQCCKYQTIEKAKSFSKKIKLISYSKL